MNKDVIYIDVEDDITAIIGKVKDAKEKIVALVPPKRVGVLQSAVNLRLLVRAGSQSGKHLVLITNNNALMSLAASAKIPVAKTLQSKPELAEVSALDVDDGEDVIDGSELPIGDHAAMAGAKTPNSAIEDLIKEDNMAKATPPAPGDKPAKPKNRIKVPNFNKFRKKLILIGAGIVLFIAFLIWAIFFAPHATIEIKARTSDSSADSKVTLDPSANTSLASGAIKLKTEQDKKDAGVDFDTTGTKEIGTKASGSITVRNCDYANGFSLPAGTKFTAGNVVFVSTGSASVPGYSSPSSSSCSLSGSSAGRTTVSVQAMNVGDSYNVSSRSYTIDSIPSGSKVDANGTDMSGGTKRTAKVVSQNDIQKATDQLTQKDSDEIKKELSEKLGKDVAVIDQTFKVTLSNTKSSPAVNEEATKARLTATITYSIGGVEYSESGRFLDEYFAKQIEGKDNQRVYDNGAKKATFNNVNAAGNGFTASMVATAKIGPKIDDAAIKEMAKGKRYGEIQGPIESIDGVDSVDIKFSPFWVSSVPNDIKKISIEFKLKD